MLVFNVSLVLNLSFNFYNYSEAVQKSQDILFYIFSANITVALKPMSLKRKLSTAAISIIVYFIDEDIG